MLVPGGGLHAAATLTPAVFAQEAAEPVLYEVIGYAEGSDAPSEKPSATYFECAEDDPARAELESAAKSALSRITWDKNGVLLTRFEVEAVTDEALLKAFYDAKSKSDARQNASEEEILGNKIDELSEQLRDAEQTIAAVKFENGNLTRQVGELQKKLEDLEGR